MSNVLKGVALKTVQSTIKDIRAAEGTTIAGVNKIAPQLVAHVLDGGSLGQIHALFKALRGSRRSEVERFFCAMLPHEWNKQERTFGKKLQSEKRIERHTQAWAEFQVSGQTVFGWIELSKDKEAKPVTPEAVRKAMQSAVKKGESIQMTADDLLAMLTDIIAADAAKQKAA